MENASARSDAMPDKDQAKPERGISMAVFERLANEINQKAAVHYLVEEIVEMRSEIARIVADNDTLELEAEESTEDSESEQADEHDEFQEAAEAIVQTSKLFTKCEDLEGSMVKYILSDVAKLSALGYLGAIILAGSRKQPDIVIPYIGRWLELFFEADLPEESRGLQREIFAAMAHYGRLGNADAKKQS